MGARSQESDAPTEVEDTDPEVHFKRKGCSVKSTKDVLPSTQSKILEKREVEHEKNLNKSARVLGQESSKVSVQTRRPTQHKPKMYKFVHSNGNVDVVTDMTTDACNDKQVSRSSKLGHGHLSDSDQYLTPSQTEPDDFEEMSRKPVSMCQVDGLKKSVEARQRYFGKDVHANLPVYYSTNKISKQRDAEQSKRYDKAGKSQASRHRVSTVNRGHGRRDGSSGGSSNSDSGGSSDGDYNNSERKDVLHRHKREFRRKSGNSSNSSKENESDGDELFKEGSHVGMKECSRRHNHHRGVSSSGDRSKGRKKGYMKNET